MRSLPGRLFETNPVCPLMRAVRRQRSLSRWPQRLRAPAVLMGNSRLALPRPLRRHRCSDPLGLQARAAALVGSDWIAMRSSSSAGRQAGRTGYREHVDCDAGPLPCRATFPSPSEPQAHAYLSRRPENPGLEPGDVHGKPIARTWRRRVGARGQGSTGAKGREVSCARLPSPLSCDVTTQRGRYAQHADMPCRATYVPTYLDS